MIERPPASSAELRRAAAVLAPTAHRRRRSMGLALAALAALATGLASPVAARAEFRISPLRLDLKDAGDTATITVVNVGKSAISLQMSAAAWTQDEAGKDRYAKTADLVYFPKLVVLDPEATQIIRVALKEPAGDREKSYRLYVEQLPQPGGKREGPTIMMLTKFGVAVYALPPEEHVGGEITSAGVSGGIFHALVRNTGNVHFRIRNLRVQGLDRDGGEIFLKEVEGWYLLSGAARRHEIPIPAEICSRLAKVRFSATTDATTLEGEAAVEEGNCAR